jgi:5-methylcytosine-specific restriction enzyme subunit McrC
VLWDPDAHHPFGNVRPDVMVTFADCDVRIPIDAKYKEYDNKKLVPADLYQAAIYAMALARVPDPAIRPCVLFYPSAPPSATPTITQRVQVRAAGGALAEVTAVGLPVERLLAEHRLAENLASRQVAVIVGQALEVQRAVPA